MKLVRFIILSFLLIGCQHGVKYHAQLSKQRLAPRPGYDGYLTNRICGERNFWGECLKWDIKSYDINDPEVRIMMNDFRIACQIGGKRFRISLDQPGFVRRTTGKCIKKKVLSRSCKKWELLEDFIHIQRYEYLIEAHTECKGGW